MSADRQQQDANDKATQESDTKAGSLLATCPLKAQTVKIVPVRYALDEFQLVPEPCPKHNLPSEGNFPGGYFSKQLKCNSYTLRQLTDGWLYVWNQTEKTLHEYEVRGPQLIRYQFGDNEADKPLSERGTALEPKVYLEYNRGSELYLMFSQLRCSWPMLEHYRSNGEAQRRWGRKLSLPGFCRTMAEPHTAPIKVLSQVADIAGEAKFPLAVPSLQDRGEGDEKISGKPVQPLTTYLGPISDKDSALMVALDDIWSDICDIASQTFYLSGQMHEFNEDEMYRRMNAKAVVQICGGLDMLGEDGWLHNDKLPPKVRGNELAINRYLDKLTDYREAVNRYEDQLRIYAAQGAKGIVSPDEFLKLEQELAAEYGSAWNLDLPRWEAERDRRKYANMQKAESFLTKHLQHDSALMEEIGPRVDELFDCHFHIQADARVLGADCHHPSHQEGLTTWMSDSLQLLVMFLDDAKRDILASAFSSASKAQALIALTTSGFDPLLHQELNGHLQKPAALLSATGVSVSNNAVLRMNEVKAAFNELPFIEHKWATDLHQDVHKTLDAMRQAFADKTSQGWSHVLEAIFPLFRGEKGISTHSTSLMLQSLLINSFVEDIPLKIEELSDYEKAFQTYQEKLSALEGKVGGLKKQESNLKKAIGNADKKTKDAKRKQKKNKKTYKQGRKKAVRRAAGKGKEFRNKLQKVTGEISEAEEAFQLLVEEKPYWAAAKQQAVTLESRRQLSEGIKGYLDKGKKLASHITLGRTAILLGYLNLLYTPMPDSYSKEAFSPESSDAESKKLHTLIYNTGYLVAFGIAAIWYDPLLTKIKQTTAQSGGKNIYKVTYTVDKRIIPLFKLSFNEASNIHGVEFAKVLKSFRMASITLGIAAGVASLYEGAQIGQELGLWGDHAADLNSIEKFLKWTQGITILANLGGAAYYLAVGATVAAGSAFFVPVVAVAGLVYLTASVALIFMSRDDIDKWLDHSDFGTSPLWRNTPQEAFQHLQDILLKPAVYMQPSCSSKLAAILAKSSVPGALLNSETVSGCWLLFNLPTAGSHIELAEVYHEYTLWGATQITDSDWEGMEAIAVTPEAVRNLIENGFPETWDEVDDGYIAENNSQYWLMYVPLTPAEFFESPLKSQSELWLNISRPRQRNIDKTWHYKLQPKSLSQVFGVWGKLQEEEAKFTFPEPNEVTGIVF
ncbi:hypothetical protein I6M48_04210 [Shewanella algae]|uniref:toxin VasX n=1 Tax=Shewanella algae TaxID=38313 RepID=UPI001AAF7D8A|nr:toxin VasX [Shewanella algae]MBO2631705.1 hypothetical protein [Shewanella algae]